MAVLQTQKHFLVRVSRIKQQLGKSTIRGSQGWDKTSFVEHDGLELRNLPASAS